MEKFINSFDDIKLGRKIGGGSCSEIYEFSGGVYFKKFCEDYCDLTDPINIEFLETIRTISEIDFLPYIIRATDIYRNDMLLFGYTMDEVSGDILDDVSDDVLVFDIMSGFENLKPGIRKLSDNFVKTEDIGGDNILYNGNMYLLDLDLSLVDKRYIPDELYENTRRSVFRSLFKRVTGSNFTDIVKYDEYGHYIEKIVDNCSNCVDFEVKTIEQLKTAYQKTYKKGN